MPVDKLRTKARYSSGSIPPGANIVINVIGPSGDRDSAPDTGYEWKVKHNGVPLNAPAISAIAEAMETGTPDRRDFNIKLKPHVRGSLEITLRGHDASTRQLNERWSYTIDSVAVPDSTLPSEDRAGPFPGLLDAVEPINTRLARVEIGLTEVNAKLDELLRKS